MCGLTEDPTNHAERALRRLALVVLIFWMVFVVDSHVVEPLQERPQLLLPLITIAIVYILNIQLILLLIRVLLIECIVFQTIACHSRSAEWDTSILSDLIHIYLSLVARGRKW